MDKIKNLINPGSKKDDEVMYGSGVSDDPIHSRTTGTTGAVAGPGSHLSQTGSGGNDPLPSSTDPTPATDHNIASERDPLATSTNPTGGSQYEPSNASHSTHGLKEPYASRMPGAFDDEAASTASIRSGVPGQATHSGPSLTGAHDPLHTDKPLPRDPASSSSGLTGPPVHHGETDSSLSGIQYPDRSTGSSSVGGQTSGTSHLGRDTALGTGVGAIGAEIAAHHNPHGNIRRDDYAPETSRSFPLGGSSNTGIGSDNSTGQAGLHTTGSSTAKSTTGPHSSDIGNKADPRVDSDLDGSHVVGNTGLASGTGATTGSTHQSSVGGDVAPSLGTGAVTGGTPSATPGYGPESWAHEHGVHGHQYGGDPCAQDGAKAEGPHFVSGPHATDTANRLDPHVGAGGNIGTASSSLQSHHARHSEGVTPASGATGLGPTVPGSGHDIPHSTTGGSSTTGPGYPANTNASSTGPASRTAGPHKSDLLNKIDPRVDSDLSKQRDSSSVTSSNLPTSGAASSDPKNTHSSDHHYGEGAALGGSGLAGAASYEAEKHHGRNEPHLSGSTTRGALSTDPLSSSANDSQLGHKRSDVPDYTTRGSGIDHHLGRDVASGTGAGGLAHDAGRHHEPSAQTAQIPSGSSTSAHDTPYNPSGFDDAGNRLAGSSQEPATSKDHHYGRDAALGAGVGGLAYESGKHHGTDDAGVAPTPQGQLAGSGHQYDHFQPTSDRPHEAGPGQHLDRDAAIGGFGHGNQRGHQDPVSHDHRKEEALAGGAAVGGLAHHEHSQEKALQKEQAKEEKALEKEHAKEVKQHDKAVAKEEKALEKEHAKEIKQHDKAVAKEEKALEKDQKAHEKERAKHLAAIEKDQKKHEHDKHEHEGEHEGEKKKGGLLGFLHRDKPDKELKEDEAARKASQAGTHQPGERDLSNEARAEQVDSLAGEHGSQSSVHDTPISIGSGNTTHEAYGTQEGHNKLHKDPPAKVLEARGQDYQGHGNIS